MPKITLDLIRKRSEHNEGEISTLEEIALHQENIEKIELLDKVCRDLKILLLQNNLISKIENLGKLKRLEYLNLALNNIEAIENLEGLESLKKLDLTVNFIGDLRGIEGLRRNEHLEELILMGNPCTDYEGYREYAIATLPQLKELDMRLIQRSERIKALQVYAEVEGDIVRGYRMYRKKREAQINSHREKYANDDKDHEEAGEEDEEENEKFWKQTSQHTPEDRVAIAKRSLRKEERRNRKDEKNHERKQATKLFTSEGKPYNMNQGKIPFRLNDEDDANHVTLDVSIYKYLDTSYVDVDVHPTYVRVTIKGKILQLTLPCEVSVENSTAKRNVTSGNLVITMPRLNPSAIVGQIIERSNTEKERLPPGRTTNTIQNSRSSITRREYLEIGPPTDNLDFSTIVPSSCSVAARKAIGDKKESCEMECTYDNPDVPPLE